MRKRGLAGPSVGATENAAFALSAGQTPSSVSATHRVPRPFQFCVPEARKERIPPVQLHLHERQAQGPGGGTRGLAPGADAWCSPGGVAAALAWPSVGWNVVVASVLCSGDGGG